MQDDLTGLEHGRVDLKLFFNNGFGVSVVRHSHSYGGVDGLFEAAVLHGTEERWEITYDTPITGNVMGWLSWSEVQQVVGRVALLELKVVETAFD
jgi:hypothetical protein